jgi:hypothetical protein
LYLGSEVEYKKVDDLNDAYRRLKNHMRTAGRLDMKIANPTYMKPLKTKFRNFKTTSSTGGNIDGKNV